MGDSGSLSLYGHSPERHRLFAEHCTAEYRVRTNGRGREVDEWKLRPTGFDNHWFDGMVGCAVGASMMGVVLKQSSIEDQSARKNRIKLSELSKR